MMNCIRPIIDKFDSRSYPLRTGGLNNTRLTTSAPSRIARLEFGGLEFHYIDEENGVKPTWLHITAHGTNFCVKRIFPIDRNLTINYLCPHNRVLRVPPIESVLAYNQDDIVYAQITQTSAKFQGHSVTMENRKKLAGTEKSGCTADLKISRFQYSENKSYMFEIRETWRLAICRNLQDIEVILIELQINEKLEGKQQVDFIEEKLKIVKCILNVMEAKDYINAIGNDPMNIILDRMAIELDAMKRDRNGLEGVDCVDITYLNKLIENAEIKLEGFKLIQNAIKCPDAYPDETCAIGIALLQRRLCGQESLAVVVPNKGITSSVSKVLSTAKRAGFEPTKVVINVCRAPGNPVKKLAAIMPFTKRKYKYPMQTFPTLSGSFGSH